MASASGGRVGTNRGAGPGGEPRDVDDILDAHRHTAHRARRAVLPDLPRLPRGPRLSFLVQRHDGVAPVATQPPDHRGDMIDRSPRARVAYRPNRR